MTSYSNSSQEAGNAALPSSENKRNRKTQMLTALLSATALGVFLEGCGDGGSGASQGTADNPFRGSASSQAFVAISDGWVTYIDVSASQFSKSTIVDHFQQHRPAWVSLLDPFPQTFSSGVVASLADSSINLAGARGDTYTNIENLIGTNYVDALEGNSNNNILGGLAGDDLLSGQEGDDVLIGGAGGDYLNGGGGDDTASYFLALETTSTLEVFFAGFVLTESYWATWYSSLSATFVAGVLASLTTPTANFGEAQYDAYVSIENLEGSEHVDILEGDNNFNIIWGNAGDDLLLGLGEGDVLSGGEGDDLLLGGDGSDFLHGGKGNDILIGEAGNDAYGFNANDGTDFIYDIDTPGQEDIVFISDATGIYRYSDSNTDSFTFARIAAGTDDKTNDLRITTDLGNVVTIIDYYEAPTAYTIHYESNVADSYILSELKNVIVPT